MLCGMRRIGFALALGLVALIVAAPASAAEAWVSGDTLFFMAGPGETNDVEISQGSGGTTIMDNGATIDPGAGCTALSANEVTCAEGSPWVRLRDGNDTGVVVAGHAGVLGGPGDDELSLCAACSGSLYGNDGNDHLVSGDVYSILDGGAGNDVLEGGDGPQWLGGQTGNDLITAGPGIDSIAPVPVPTAWTAGPTGTRCSTPKPRAGSSSTSRTGMRSARAPITSTASRASSEAASETTSAGTGW